MALNPGKVTTGDQSMYYLDKETSLKTGVVAVDGATGELVGEIYFAKPQKDVKLCFTPTTSMTGTGVLALLDSDDNEEATVTIASGSATTQVGTATYPLGGSSVLPAGAYNISVKTSATTGDGTPFVISKEAYQVDVAD